MTSPIGAVTSNQGPFAGRDAAALTLNDGKITAADGTGQKLEDVFKGDSRRNLSRLLHRLVRRHPLVPMTLYVTSVVGQERP
jgi:hypothetical protein